MKAIEKLKIAKEILEQEFSNEISSLSLNFVYKRLNFA